MTTKEIIGSDRYQILPERIRFGATDYECYLVRGQSSGRLFTAKILESADWLRVATALKNEARNLAALRSPYLIALVEVCVLENGIALILEQVEGITLTEWAGRIRRQYGQIDSLLALHMLRQLAQALVVMTNAGIVHQNIEPDNILVGSPPGDLRDFRIRIWGFEQAHRDSAQAKWDTGTAKRLAYWAPEQINRQSVSARTDIYGVGCVLYSTLTGEPPYQGGALKDLVLRIVDPRSGPIPLRSVRSDLDADVIRIVERCMAKEPAGRFRTPQEIINEINNLRVENPLDYLLEQAQRARLENDWMRVIQLAEQARSFRSGELRFQDLLQEAHVRIKEERVEGIQHEADRISALIPIDIATARQGLYGLKDRLRSLADDPQVQTILGALENEINQGIRFAPAMLVSETTNRAYPLNQAQLSIGRLMANRRNESTSLINLGDEPGGSTVSRTQAYLDCTNGQWKISHAVKARNMTKVNGRSIQEAYLQSGDNIQLGDVRLKFEIASAS